MEPGQFVLPTLATIALGAALLVPLRDDRRGRRATLGGHQPLRPDFADVASVGCVEPEANSYATEPIVDGADCDPTSETVPPDEAQIVFIEGAHEPPQNDAPRLSDTHVRDRPSILRWLRAVVSGSAMDGRRRSAQDDRNPAATSDVAANDRGATGTSRFEDFGSESTIMERSFAAELDSLLNPTCTNRAEGSGLVNDADQSTKPDGIRTIDEPFRESDASSNVSVRFPSLGDRIVPITRLPLRPQTLDVTWPHELDPPRLASSRDDRYALLKTLARNPDDAIARILESAFRQEDAQGRLLALRALSRTTATQRSRTTFLEALKMGTDDERAMAVDALVTHGACGDLAAACNDRVDAIAAQAALAFVASDRRADYRVALSPFVDPARIDTILILLAGVVE